LKPIFTLARKERRYGEINFNGFAGHNIAGEIIFVGKHNQRREKR